MNTKIKTTPNWKKGIDLTSKCGSCIHYKSFYKKDMLTAHGNCQLRNNGYKQRTDSCLKYEGVEIKREATRTI